MKNLQGHVVAITGAANGLGKSLATEFHKIGCHLVLMDIDFEGLQKLKDDLQGSGQRVSIHHVNVAQEQDIVSARKEILEAHQRLDILINNAGISISQLFQDMDLTDFRNLLEVKILGHRALHKALPSRSLEKQ
jgi:NADP-dependent 3-hydroxy acid dehydrogenase YdfG